MILSEGQRESYEAVVRPLIKWLNDNCNPHATVVVNCSRAELHEGDYLFETKDYWKD